MHRRVQVEVEWFIALSDAGLEGFAPFSEAARGLLRGLVVRFSEADASAIHAVAYNRFGAALGTGRLLEHVPGVAKIGRMAVRQSVRGSGVGRAVLDALLEAARQRGDREAILHAQLSAAPFYVRAGFSTRGPAFEEAGIPHVEMVRSV